MDPSGWHELFVLFGGLGASAFAIVRTSLLFQQRLLERFIGSLDRAADRQESALDRFEASLQQLRETVQENSATVKRISDWLVSDRRSA